MCTIGPKFRLFVHHHFRHPQQQFEVPTEPGPVLLGAVSVPGVLQSRLKGTEITARVHLETPNAFLKLRD